MTPGPKRLALQYRIWAYAHPREWDVTIQDIAAALGEPVQRVNKTVHFAGWGDRVRALYDQKNDSGRVRHFGAFLDGRHVVAEVLAGRVNSEFTT